MAYSQKTIFYYLLNDLLYSGIYFFSPAAYELFCTSDLVSQVISGKLIPFHKFFTVLNTIIRFLDACSTFALSHSQKDNIFGEILKR